MKKRFAPALIKEADRVKAEFVKVRSPLTKMEPSDRHSQANRPIAYPCIGSDLGAAWRIGPQTFVSRRILSDLFLDFLEKLNAATSQTSK
jgi:hypothetical protein